MAKLSDVLKVNDGAIEQRSEPTQTDEPWRTYLRYVEDAKAKLEIVLSFEEWQQAKKEEEDAKKLGAQQGDGPHVG